LWTLSDHEKLSEQAKAEILSSENRKLVSLASAWEVAIKISLKKLFYESGVTRFLHQVEYDGFELMPISGKHIMISKISFTLRMMYDRLLPREMVSYLKHFSDILINYLK
jgi:PIN domain nuclease of toxin-antitoxin system